MGQERKTGLRGAGREGGQGKGESGKRKRAGQGIGGRDSGSRGKAGREHIWILRTNPCRVMAQIEFLTVLVVVASVQCIAPTVPRRHWLRALVRTSGITRVCLVARGKCAGVGPSAAPWPATGPTRRRHRSPWLRWLRVVTRLGFGLGVLGQSPCRPGCPDNFSRTSSNGRRALYRITFGRPYGET